MSQAMMIGEHEATWGDCWEARELNRLVPVLLRHGFAVVEGSLSAEGFAASKGGETLIFRLIAPSKVSVWRFIPDDEAPGDNFPVIAS